MKADNYFTKGLSANTHRTYSAAQRQYLDFCSKHDLTPLPADETTLLLFVTHLAQRIRPQSIKVYLAGVRALHLSNGHHSPLTNTIKLNQTLRGIEREHFITTTKKLPITFDLLCQMHPLIDLTDFDDVVYWSAMTTAHFLLLRAGEFVTTDSSQTVPSICDLQLETSPEGQEYMALHISKSKTDQKRQGVTLYTGHANHKVCAVCAMKSNLRQQRTVPATNNNTPLFRLSTGCALTRQNLKTFLTTILRLLNIPSDQYSTHSFRIGGATSAAIAGLKDFEIQLLGRWSSDCYKRYIRSPLSTFLAIPQKLSATQHIVYQYATPYSPSEHGEDI